MPFFAYKGRRSDQSMVDGVLEAMSESALADQLLNQGITPVSIVPAKSSSTVDKKNGFDFSQLLKPRVNDEDLLLFSQQLHTLLKAGLPIIRALSGLQESAVNPAMAEVIGDIRESLESGRELSAALVRHPKVFSPFYVSMVRVGESTGMLDEVFLRLFQHLEFDRFMREQVKTALRYPMFVMIAMAIAIVVINILVIPAFARVFQGFGAELPLMTRVLLGFSNFMVNWWPVLLVGIAGAVVAFQQWRQTAAGQYRWEAITLRLPIAGPILLKAALARFARSYALGTRSGVPIMQALSNAAQTVDNSYISKRIEGMRQHVERGESLLRAAITAKFFTPLVLQMIAVGEESGALDDMMEKIGALYQREVEYELKSLGAKIEPILLVFLGALVLVLALGIFLPMWDLGKVTMKK